MDKARLNRIAGSGLAGYVRFVERTSRVIADPEDFAARSYDYRPFILATWHGQFMMLPALSLSLPKLDLRSIVARHGDAAIMAEMSRQFGVEPIFGSGAGGREKDRGGLHALREAVRALKGGSSVFMTADMPPGPARKAGLGIVTMARQSGRPIVPFGIATRRFHSFDTWSRFTLNLPFSTLAITTGVPVWVAPGATVPELEAARREVEASLNEAMRRAYRLAGADIRRTLPRWQTEPQGPIPPGRLLKGYRAMTGMAAPLAPVALERREKFGKEDPARRPERLGQPSRPRPAGELAWFHAASIGEMNAILPLMSALKAKRPGLTALLTTGTVTSARLAEGRLEAGDVHQYAPIDTPAAVAGFLDHWRPELAVFAESEVWPNLVLAISERRIPLALVNATMSKRSFARWRRFKSTARQIFSQFALVLAQNEKPARWFGDIGARRSIPVGNLKYDAPPPPIDRAAFQALEAAIGDRPLFLAASTHPGEEEIIADAHAEVARTMPRLLTIIIPRHPSRGAEVAQMLAARSFEVGRRALGALPGPQTQIYVADTLGELGTFFALSKVSLIGGSLVDKSGKNGHNPIEAAKHGTVILSGPFTESFAEAFRVLGRNDAARFVKTAQELADALKTLLTDAAERERMRAGTATALRTLQGALAKTVNLLLGLMPPSPGAAPSPSSSAPGEVERVA